MRQLNGYKISFTSIIIYNLHIWNFHNRNDDDDAFICLVNILKLLFYRKLFCTDIIWIFYQIKSNNNWSSRCTKIRALLKLTKYIVYINCFIFIGCSIQRTFWCRQYSCNTYVNTQLNIYIIDTVYHKQSRNSINLLIAIQINDLLYFSLNHRIMCEFLKKEVLIKKWSSVPSFRYWNDNVMKCTFR